jgi:hypothetical protein
MALTIIQRRRSSDRDHEHGGNWSYAFEPAPSHWNQTSWPRGLRGR